MQNRGSCEKDDLRQDPPTLRLCQTYTHAVGGLRLSVTLYLGLRAINDEMALISIAGIGKGKSKSTVANKENIEISNRRHFFIY